MPAEFESLEVCKVVGIKTNYLNKFVEKGQFRVSPSIRSGRGRGMPRRFSEEDLDGIALVWWLFESGLRAKAIQFVLNQVAKVKDASALKAANKLKGQRARYLLISREPRSFEEKNEEHPAQRVQIVRSNRVGGKLDSLNSAVTLIIPVGRLFEELQERIVQLQDDLKGEK